jgi:uncharacterized protein YcbX
VARVVELNYFPVKGCAGISVADALLTPAGLAHDRSFLVTDTDGVFRSQRTDPRLALIQPEVSADGDLLTLGAPDGGAVTVDVDLLAPRREVLLFNSPYQGIDQGETVAEWLSEVLGAPSRLVRVPPEHRRVTDGLTPGTAGYADSGAVHVTAVESLRELNERIVAGGGEPVPMTRFRPNIVVEGWQAHEEDRARHVTIGQAELGYSKLAVRCAVSTVDQDLGTKAGPEPLHTLATYRRAGSGGVAFGVKFAVLRSGKLSVGDELAVFRWADSEL